jgi:hypothetical protein
MRRTTVETFRVHLRDKPAGILIEKKRWLAATVFTVNARAMISRK